ncbi:MAG: FAD:protein FMN transferase [Burkholderiaceae bacterium]
MADRRRFLSIVAACAASAPFAGARAGAAAEAVAWRGTAMGALASMTLVHSDREKAQALVQRCIDEIRRLESVFSLYRADSSLSRLNAAGELRDPPVELVELMSQSLDLARSSGGAFDPTVQPLYRLYAAHFALPDASATGPSAAAISATLRNVGFAGVELRADHIRLRRPGMGITLNGIAQGFVTDRVADLLHDAGLVNLMIDLGEARAHGRSARAMRGARRSPTRASRRACCLESRRWARTPRVARTGHVGRIRHRLRTDPRIHHLFDPGTGRSVNRYLSVSVAAPRAAMADGLSTALSVMPPSAPPGCSPTIRWHAPGSSSPTARSRCWVVAHGPTVRCAGA